MGISTSGAALVVFAAMFLALGTLHGTASDAVERVNAAEEAQVKHSLAIHATAMNLTNASYNTTADVFTIKAVNTGERPIDVEALSVVGDANFVPQTEFEAVTVAGRESSVWRPGQELVLQDVDGSIDGLVEGSAPDYTKLVTADGVAALSEVRSFG